MLRFMHVLRLPMRQNVADLSGAERGQQRVAARWVLTFNQRCEHCPLMRVCEHLHNESRGTHISPTGDAVQQQHLHLASSKCDGMKSGSASAVLRSHPG